MTAVTTYVTLNEDNPQATGSAIVTAIDGLDPNATDHLSITQKGSVVWITKTAS